MIAQQEWLFACCSCGFAASTLAAGSGRGIGGLEALRRHNFRNLIAQLRGSYALVGKSLLEVGCAEGWFLEEARRHEMNVSAIEPSAPHAEMASANGFKVISGFFPADLSADVSYDFIVFNDVFEHLPDPISAIKFCADHLRPGGVLVLNLPSNRGIIYRAGTLLARLGKLSTLERLWQKNFPSPHLSYFNPATLTRFVTKQTSLRHVNTFPLDTIAADGLLERIKASHPGIVGRIVYFGLLASLPIFRFLPADIIVGVYEKP